MIFLFQILQLFRILRLLEVVECFFLNLNLCSTRQWKFRVKNECCSINNNNITENVSFSLDQKFLLDWMHYNECTVQCMFICMRACLFACLVDCFRTWLDLIGDNILFKLAKFWFSTHILSIFFVSFFMFFLRCIDLCILKTFKFYWAYSCSSP